MTSSHALTSLPVSYLNLKSDTLIEFTLNVVKNIMSDSFFMKQGGSPH